MIERVEELNRRLAGMEAGAVMEAVVAEFPGRVAFSSSLGAEDQVITHMIAGRHLPVSIFTLDTGRMFQETYDLVEVTRSKYGIALQVYFPDAVRVEKMVSEHGINLFYESIENRRLCCHIRKREPLKRALAGMQVWITGVRREQSVTRSGMTLVEWDSELALIKVNPLSEWSEDQVWEFIRREKVPVSELHAKGYPSIGCLPCTRPVQPGGDVRSGRWWWELPQFRECGLHTGKAS